MTEKFVRSAENVKHIDKVDFIMARQNDLVSATDGNVYVMNNGKLEQISGAVVSATAFPATGHVAFASHNTKNADPTVLELAFADSDFLITQPDPKDQKHFNIETKPKGGAVPFELDVMDSPTGTNVLFTITGQAYYKISGDATKTIDIDPVIATVTYQGSNDTVVKHGNTFGLKLVSIGSVDVSTIVDTNVHFTASICSPDSKPDVIPAFFHGSIMVNGLTSTSFLNVMIPDALETAGITIKSGKSGSAIAYK